MKRKSLCTCACVLSLALSACSTPQPEAKHYQQNLLKKCPEELALLGDGTGRDVALTMNAWAKTYHDCKTRHNGLVDAVQQ